MKKLGCTILALLVLSMTASAQSYLSNFGFSGGWAHISSNQGTDGFNVGAELVVVRPVAIAADYDMTWDTSTIGVFQLTSVGQISSHTRQINGLIGPRVYFPTHKVSGSGCGVSFLHKVDPFLEAQFGESNLNSTVQSINAGSFNASSTAFTWQLGGGADIRLAPKWAFRSRADFLRTHFANQGQSALRLVFGIAYSIKARPGWEKK